MNDRLKYFLSLQTAVMLFGAASIFGKLIPLNPFMLVLGRTAWASLFLLIMMFFLGEKFSGKYKENLSAAVFSGALLSFHWVAFFQSAVLSNVAVAVLTFSTFPLFTILFAPLFKLGKIKPGQLLVGFIILTGIAVMIYGDDLKGTDYLYGIVWGIFSALSFALLTLTNKKRSVRYGPFEQAFWQNLGAALFLLPSVFFFKVELSFLQHFYWLLLGTVFTGLSHGLYVYSLKGTDAQKASLYAALEPVYAIVWAAVFLAEFPSAQEIYGGLIILGAIWFGLKK